ncbi:MAG TPA: VOC family protein [Candidatus Sulfotelmatobacter sp.]|jgi:catechol 2,3-dioxygenase-like lactoylglutathione lyase family enzyme
MNKLTLLLVSALVPICAFAQAAPQRPRILGIDHVSFYTTNPNGVKKLFAGVLGLASADPIESGESVRYLVGTQWVGYSPAPDPKATDRMDHVAFSTDNIVALRRYLTAQGVRVPEIQVRNDRSLFFVVNDPEGHRIEFVERTKQEGKGESASAGSSAASHHMIHAGFVVYHPDAEDRFYRDILGFRLYWHGHDKPDTSDDWVAMQVPDGTDWLEYMLNQPEHMDLEQTGEMNHISLGVADMKKAQAIMESNGWKAHRDEQAEIGKDGKWQLDVFDPDLSRVELMEFKNVQKPCCNDFSGPHPAD